MPLTEADLPEAWTDNYSHFNNFDDKLVIATCKRCFCTVNSDFFADHTSHCITMSLRSML